MTLAHHRVILFDLDGTLVNTMDDLADLAASILARTHDLNRALARSTYLETSGVPFRLQLGTAFPGHPANERAVEEFESRKPAICRAARMEAEVERALGELHARGFRLGISSSAGQELVDAFHHRYPTPFVLALGDEPRTALHKGEPHLRLVEQELGVRREEILFVGDSLEDARMAEECGLVFIGRTGTVSREVLEASPATALLVDSVSRLPAALRRSPAAPPPCGTATPPGT